MKRPLVAVVSFPGNNCEVESLRALRRCGMDAVSLRWNSDRSACKDVDGYFLPGGFAYEDRGRSGMVAARDPVMEFIGQEAESGKAVIGNCNGAQVLVESGLIPLGSDLHMSLARNSIRTDRGPKSTGFISEWVWVKRACAADRCATSDWEGVMHMPLAHGEGRFVTEDKDLWNELKAKKQIAFSYCDEQGNVSEDPHVTPNGSTLAIAGICNEAGNVVALMPHPERTDNGDPYFHSLCRWLQRKRQPALSAARPQAAWTIGDTATALTELFIDTIITNNEERTVEKAAKRHAPGLRLKQWKYLALPEQRLAGVLKDLTVFNPNKERAYIRRGKTLTRWAGKAEQAVQAANDVFRGTMLLRRDLPDSAPAIYGDGAMSGVCYGCEGISAAELDKRPLLEVFCNPHASTLEKIPV